MYSAVTDCTDPFDNLVWFPSISLCLSTFIFSLSSLFAHLPAVFGSAPVGLARSPLQGSLRSIYHHHWLRFSASWKCFSGRPAGIPHRDAPTHTHTRSARTHTHTHTDTQPETKCWSRHRIYHFYLFIYSSLSVHLSIGFVSWADISLINYLLLLKETTWGAQRREWRKQNEER